MKIIDFTGSELATQSGSGFVAQTLEQIGFDPDDIDGDTVPSAELSCYDDVFEEYSPTGVQREGRTATYWQNVVLLLDDTESLKHGASLFLTREQAEDWIKTNFEEE